VTATESTIKVGYPLPLLRESHTFAIRDGSDLPMLSMRSLRVSSRDLARSTQSLSNSRLIEAADGLDYLLAYPYGCVEQTTSSLIPWLSTQQLRKVMPKLEKTEEESCRDQQGSGASLLHADGGWWSRLLAGGR
jgi:hypothetical protein